MLRLGSGKCLDGVVSTVHFFDLQARAALAVSDSSRCRTAAMKNHTVQSELEVQERRLEDDAILEGVRRYRKQVCERGFHSRLGTSFASKWVTPLIETIRREQENLLNGKIKGRFQRERILFLTLDPDRLAVITLQCIVDGFASALLDLEEHKDLEARWLHGSIGRNCFKEYVADRRREYFGWAEESHLVRELVIGSRLRKKRPSAFRAAVSYERKLRLYANLIIREARYLRIRQKEDFRPYNDYFRLGELLVECAKHAHLVVEGEGRKKVWSKHSLKEGDITGSKVIRLAAKVETSLDRNLRTYESICPPVHSPMVYQPRPWKGLRGGGYVYNSGDPHFGLELVKYKNRRRLEEILKETRLNCVTSAVNSLQRVKWRVNKVILTAMRQLWSEKQDFAGLPAIPRLPRRPHPGQAKEKFRRWWVAYQRIKHARLAAIIYRRKLMCERFETAERMAGKTIYFPYFLDFRGRAYPTSRVFHPQDDDIGRALLEFADGKPLSRSGTYWLSVHLANLYGKDKEPVPARRKWVRKNEARIIRLAENPFDPTLRKWWMDADKPWCFLAACYEWKEYCRHRKKRHPRHFESHLPVAMDGTCNGLQHLSALGRDPVGGQLTNLRPGRVPQDIYKAVADEMNKTLLEERWGKNKRFALVGRLLEVKNCKRLAKRIASLLPANARRERRSHRAWRSWVMRQVAQARMKRKEANNLWRRLRQDEERGKKRGKQALIWLNWFESQKKPRQVRREIAKVATMNKPYGATLGGIAEQLVGKGLTPGRAEDQLANANFIASLLFECLPKIVEKAIEIMDWLQNKIARTLADKDIGLSWISPSGFPVVHEYRTAKQKRIRTRTGCFSIPDPTSEGRKLFRRKQVDAIVANLVHSLDAAHMTLTVNELRKAGKSAFAAIHDSYAVHACDVALLRLVTCKTFVQIHQEDLLGKFWERQCRRSGLSLEAPPQRGRLDIKEVLKSKYFFC